MTQWSELIDFGSIDITDGKYNPQLVKSGAQFSVQTHYVIVTKVISEITQLTTLVVSNDGITRNKLVLFVQTNGFLRMSNNTAHVYCRISYTSCTIITLAGGFSVLVTVSGP